jgi:hypothetical protein
MPTVYSPPVSTYVPLATITLASTDTSITFSSIPATYRDLLLVTNGASNIADDFAYLRFNGDSGSNYSWVQMGALDASPFSSSTTTTSWRTSTFRPSGSRSMTKIQIMDYSATDKHKTGLIRDDSQYNGGLIVRAYASRWANTAAITSIEYFTTAGSLNVGFTLSLYGIAA